jgi:hypothetical protein
MKKLLLACLGAASGAALAQGLEPGQWEFTSSMIVAGAAKANPMTMNIRRCIRKEEADDPQKWWGKQASQTDCKVTPGKKGGGVYTWEVVCPKQGTRGSGVAKVGRGTMESTQTIVSERQGKKAEMTMKMSGKRVGAC